MLIRIYITGSILFFISCHSSATDWKIIKSQEGIQVKEGSDRVLFFRTIPTRQQERYERAGYVHPLYDLQGNIITEDGPADHPYHRGIFWAWHQIVWGTKQVADGWMSENIRFLPIESKAEVIQGNVLLKSKLNWMYTGQGTAEALLLEQTRITIHPRKPHFRCIDFDIALHPLVDSLALGGADDEKGYGGFCLRLKLPEDIHFFSGTDTVEAREKAIDAGPWMAFAGSFGGIQNKPSAVLAFCAKPWPGPGQLWILRKRGSMQNIEFPGREPVKLGPEGWRLRYRLVIIDNSLNKDSIEDLYQLYRNEAGSKKVRTQ